MHQHSAPGLQAKVVPQREHRASIASLLHDWAAIPDAFGGACAIVVGSRYGYDACECLFANSRRQKPRGDLPMKNPLDSLGQTIALGVVLTLVVIALIHAIA
jgi:hypothetical protein